MGCGATQLHQQVRELVGRGGLLGIADRHAEAGREAGGAGAQAGSGRNGVVGGDRECLRQLDLELLRACFERAQDPVVSRVLWGAAHLAVAHDVMAGFAVFGDGDMEGNIHRQTEDTEAGPKVRTRRWHG